MATSLDPQLALDERAINNPDLEAALEKHLRARDDAAEARGVVKKARGEIDQLLAGVGDFDPDTALRVGRFRITKRVTEARHVEFDSSAGERLSFSLVDEDGAPVKRTGGTKVASVSDDRDQDDWDDLRPKGEVNVDALRGEVDRATLPDEPTRIPRAKGGDQPPVH